MTQVSIIIVNWKVRELLRACLASLREQAGLPAADMQIIVVDNDSRDGSAEMVAAEFGEVVLIVNPDNPGFGRANNQALSVCTGRYILLLNPDTVVLDGAVGRMVAHMDELPDVAVLGCRLLNADRSLQRWTGGAYPRALNVANHYLFLDRILPRSLRPPPLYLVYDAAADIDVDWVSGACMMLRPSLLGGKLFDPAFFMYGEDMELCHRLKSGGGRVIYSPCASIIHYQGASMKQQQGDVLLSSLKGPRQFYRQMRGERALWWFDLLTVTGFGLRWLLYSAASLVRPRQYAAKAASSRDLMNRARRIQQG
jgi:GT2 family glycosyltransferase